MKIILLFSKYVKQNIIDIVLNINLFYLNNEQSLFLFK